MEKNKKKKIVIFLPEFPVVSETFIQRDIYSLIERDNVDVSVVALSRGNGEFLPNVKEHFYLRKLCLLKALFSLFEATFNFSKFSELFMFLKQNGGGGFSDFYLVLKSFGYARMLKKFNPEEIHVHFLSDFSTLAMLCSKILKIPFSVNAHARDVTEYPHFAELKVKEAKFITVCNISAYEKLISFAGNYGEKVKLIHHGVDEKLLFGQGYEKVTPEVFTVFLGGTRLTEKKGINFMVEASKILIEEGFRHKVVQRGAGPLSSELSKQIDDLNIGEIISLGAKNVPFTEIAPHYFISSVMILPNINTDSGDRDGIPNTLIEAAFARLPIITTNAGSNEELIKDGITGFVVPQRDAKALAEKIKYLSKMRREEIEKITNAAYERASELFGQDVTVAKLETLLISQI